MLDLVQYLESTTTSSALVTSVPETTQESIYPGFGRSIKEKIKEFEDTMESKLYVLQTKTFSYKILYYSTHTLALQQ